MPKNLYIAYAVVWVLHGGYIGYLLRRMSKLKQGSK
jgi:CcmD family protein